MCIALVKLEIQEDGSRLNLRNWCICVFVVSLSSLYTRERVISECDCNADLLTVASTAAQDPFNMGYLSVKTSIALVEGQPVDRLVDTGVTIVTQENLDSPEMQQVLFPDYQKWL